MPEGNSTNGGTSDGPEEFPDPAELGDDPIDLGEVPLFSSSNADAEDINGIATEAWKSSTTTDERIRAVLKRTTTPTRVAEFAAKAAVSETKARTTLQRLQDEGVARLTTDSGVQAYERNPDRYLIERLHNLAQAGNLVEKIQSLREEIATYRDKYETDTPEDLLVSDRDLSTDEFRDISHWRTAQRDVAYLRAAYRIQEAKAYAPVSEAPVPDNRNEISPG